MPFSWKIRDYLEELWVHALKHEGKSPDSFVFLMLLCCGLLIVIIIYCAPLGQTQLEFNEFFWKTPLGRYIGEEDQDTQTEFFHRYLQDFISMTMNVTCEEELQVYFRYIKILVKL